MRENLFQNELNIEKEGNQETNGLAAIPGCPPGTWDFGTTFHHRCKGFKRGWESVFMAEARQMSCLWQHKVMGSWVRREVF